MYQNKITFTPHDIYVKEFKIDTRGYRLKEVDQFLDIVIEDYEKFLNIINGLEKEKADLLAEIMTLKQELRNVQMSAEIAKSNESNDVSNIDVIKRLSQLEKVVYNNLKTEEK